MNHRSEDFWSLKNFDLNDTVNKAIWNTTREPQNKRNSLQFRLRQCSSTANLPPWLPDIVANRVKSGGSVVVIGSAYGGFVKGYNHRSACICPEEYGRCKNAGEFLRLFLQKVARGDKNYYEPLAKLLTHAGGLRSAVITDLCRCSFTQETAGRYSYGDRVVKRNEAAFDQYVEMNKTWTLRRLFHPRVAVIVTLGHLVTRKLLHHFFASTESSGVRLDDESSRLVKHRLNQYKKGSRMTLSKLGRDGGRVIKLQGAICGKKHIWHILPIHHPARHRSYDKNYKDAAAALRELW